MNPHPIKNVNNQKIQIIQREGVLNFDSKNVISDAILNTSFDNEEWFEGVDNPINQFKNKQMSLQEILLPYYDYMKWCSQNIGKKFILRNMDFFIFSTIIFYVILGTNTIKK